MLSSIDRKTVKQVPHWEEFEMVKRRLGKRLPAIYDELNRIIDKMENDSGTGHRSFSSSFLGSKLEPWQPPISSLYDVAKEILGETAEEQDVEDRAALIFGLFVWDCIMKRDENWVFYDPNLSGLDPNREITGKVYFENDELKI